MRIVNILGLTVAACFITLSPVAHADAWDKKTIISINGPIQIPTATLPAGTYTLKLLDSNSNRHIVTVWDEDGMRLVTTVMAIPNYRLQPTGDSRFTFWETPPNQPKALRAWFYPGDNVGQEFVYPKGKAVEIAALNVDRVPALYSPSVESQPVHEAPAPQPNPVVEPAPAPVTTAPALPEEPKPVVTPDPTPAKEPEAPAEPVAPPEPAPKPEPAAQQPASPESMPKTATHWYEVLLLGFAAATAGLFTYRKQRKA